LAERIVGVEPSRWLPLRAVLLALVVLSAGGAYQNAWAAGNCAGARRCLSIPGRSVVGAGSRRGLPYVVVKGLRVRPKTGSYVAVGASRHAPGGLAGFVIGTGRRKNVTAIVAVPPLPGVGALTGALDQARTAGAGSPLDLLPKPAVKWLEKHLGQLECQDGHEFPISLTGVDVRPWGFNLSAPDLAGAGGQRGQFAISGSMTPAATLTLKVNGKYTCKVEPKPFFDVQIPPPVAGAFYSIRTSLGVSAEAEVSGTAEGEADVGAKLSGGVVGDGTNLALRPSWKASPFVRVTKQASVHADASIGANVNLTTRLLLGHLWGPRVTVGFGWKVELKGLSSAGSGPCAEVSFPARLTGGLAFNPGFTFGTGKAADALAAWAKEFGGELDQARLPHIIKNIVAPGSGVGPLSVRLSVGEKDVWRFAKAFDTGDIVSFTAPVSTYPLTLPGGIETACPQLKVKGLDPTLKCSKVAQGCVHGPPAPACGTPSTWSQFQVSAEGLKPGRPYQLVLGGTAHGVTERKVLGTITPNDRGQVATRTFTLPDIPAHDPWTLSASPAALADTVTTTLETGLVDCVGLAAGGGAFSSAFTAVGLTPQSTLKEIVDGKTVGSAQADDNGTVPTTPVNGTCVPGRVHIQLSGFWLDHGAFTDDATDRVNQSC
jgi:hypothetical protein